jgi:hypothetical protein
MPAPANAADALARVLSRRPGDVPTILRLGRGGIVYVETGAFDTPSVRVDQQVGATLVAGEPLLTGGHPAGRDADIAALHRALTAGDPSLAATSVGTFAAVHVNEQRGTVTLVADKIGLRPIYFAVTDAVIYVASALRVIEALPTFEKVMDVRAAVETLALGYPLADRTPYAQVFTLLDGEAVTFRDEAIERRRYWRLADVPLRDVSLADAAAEVHQRFSDAITRRTGTDTRSFAFLSGGLDSRCMVAELIAKGVTLHTFNFANDGTKDEILGDAFAKVVGTTHQRTPRPAEPIRWSLTMSERWAASPHRAQMPVERPGLVWSGDGGSVGLGFVGVYASAIALLRAGRRDDAVVKYLAEHEIAFPLRVFQRRVASTLRDLVHQGVREALDDVRCVDEPGREMYFFRMAHDQRRHLALHFEDVDLHRLEFHLPFYDADLLAAVASMPVDYGVGHRLYHAALPHFPASVMQIAWQTYPGHEACPIPLPADAIDQWGDRQKDIERRRRRRGILAEAARVAATRPFPHQLLNRPYLMAAAFGHWLGVNDYAYAVDYAKGFTNMWRVAAGRWALAERSGGLR